MFLAPLRCMVSRPFRLSKEYFMNKITAVGVVAAAGLAGLLSAASPASAAAPSPSSSCSAQLSQGATPHGASEAEPGFLGGFVSETATSGPGVVGGSSSYFARQHGDLGECIPY